MKGLLIPTILSLLSVTASLAEELVLNLNRFQIGQYRDIIKNELGPPIKKDKFDDGFEYEIYLIKPDTSVYMIFEYAPNNLEVIWSIQLTGKKYKTDFKSMDLGIDKAKVVKTLGRPTNKIDIGEYGERWEYTGTNYSLEINTGGMLSSIKITDKSSEMFPKVDVTKIPTFSSLVTILKSKDNLKIKELLTPDIEVYTTDSTYYFRHRITDEVNKDKSGVFKQIKNLSRTLENINTNDVNEYEENVRLNLGQDPMHVIKIKRGQAIKEIVLKYQFGRYLIWEIRT